METYIKKVNNEGQEYVTYTVNNPDSGEDVTVITQKGRIMGIMSHIQIRDRFYSETYLGDNQLCDDIAIILDTFVRDHWFDEPKDYILLEED